MLCLDYMHLVQECNYPQGNHPLPPGPKIRSGALLLMACCTCHSAGRCNATLAIPMVVTMLHIPLHIHTRQAVQTVYITLHKYIHALQTFADIIQPSH